MTYKINEKWDFIKGTDNKYLVSSEGRVFSFAQHDVHEVVQTLDKRSGYYVVSILRKGKRKSEYVHRLVAETFLDNPNNYPVVNHKNEIRVDNRVENLEWCTSQYNSAYSAGKYFDCRRKGTNTGEHHISIETSTGYYVVQFRYSPPPLYKNVTVKKRFKTLDDAIEYRDEVFKTISEKVRRT